MLKFNFQKIYMQLQYKQETNLQHEFLLLTFFTIYHSIKSQFQFLMYIIYTIYLVQKVSPTKFYKHNLNGLLHDAHIQMFSFGNLFS